MGSLGGTRTSLDILPPSPEQLQLSGLPQVLHPAQLRAAAATRAREQYCEQRPVCMVEVAACILVWCQHDKCRPSYDVKLAIAPSVLCISKTTPQTHLPSLNSNMITYSELKNELEPGDTVLLVELVDPAEAARNEKKRARAEKRGHSQDSSVYGAYKPVAQRVKPVPGVFPEDARVIRQFPEDPLDTLPPLTCHPPEFKPSQKLTQGRMQDF